MKPLIIIPARGGSKGVPGKNSKLLGGKPLIHYTIEAALAVTEKENIIVSTDSEEIKSLSEKFGILVPSLRPDYLASDTAGTYEVLLYEIEKLEKEGKFFDYLILLQPTSPFRTGKQISEALMLYDNHLDMVVSVVEAKANPYYNLFEEDENRFLQKSKPGNFNRRQDCPKVWEYNGAIYIINIKSLQKKPLNKFEEVIKFEMDDISSHDIDSPLDWHIAENLLKYN